MTNHPPYIYQAYPAARYHATLPCVVVNDPREDDALGDGWHDTPAVFCPHAERGMTAADTHCPACALPAARCNPPAATEAPKPKRKR